MKKKIISVFTALTLMVLSCIGGLTFTVNAAIDPTKAALTIRSSSNFFGVSPAVTYAKGDVPEQIELDFYMDTDKYRIINGQYNITFDPAVLRLSEESNMDEDDNYTLSSVASNIVANFDESESGDVKFNFSNGNNPKRLVKSNGTVLPVVHLVFDVVGEGNTVVDLEVYKQTFTDIVPKEDYHDWYTYYILDADKGESVKKIFTDNGAKITSSVTPEDSFPTGNYIYGDVNNDGIVDITDATLIQLHVAGKKKMQLRGIAAFLADVDHNGLIDITDATFVQLYGNDSSKELELTGKPVSIVAPEPVPVTEKPTQPATEKPTQPVTSPTQPVTQPSGKSLTVEATSNIFPTATTTFDPVTRQVTVTWWINVTAVRMINTQFTVTYDKNVLTFDPTDGVNQLFDDGEPDSSLVLRCTKGEGTVINTEPETMPGGGIKGNASKLSGFKLTNANGRVPFVSVTFNPVNGAQGKTTVDLDVEIMQLGSNDTDASYFINDSEIVNKNISYLPTGTASAVYAGTFDKDK